MNTWHRSKSPPKIIDYPFESSLIPGTGSGWRANLGTDGSGTKDIATLTLTSSVNFGADAVMDFDTASNLWGSEKAL